MGKLERFVPKERPTSAKMNAMVDEVNGNTEKLSELEDSMVIPDGYYQGMRAGIADALANINGATIDYKEILTAGRMINNAPDLMTSNREPEATNGVSTITVKEVSGDVVGGNQLSRKNIPSGKLNECTVTNNGDGTITMSGTPTTYSVFGISTNSVTIGHKIMVIGCPWGTDGRNNAEGSRKTFDLRISCGSDYFSDGGRGAIFTPRANAMNVYLRSNANFDGNPITFRPNVLNLTHLFPTDQTFVNALTANDAIKVAHRLSTFTYEAPISNPTAVVQLEDDTLAKMAEVVAKLGCQPDPKLWYGSCGCINLVDGATGLVKQRVNMIEQKKKAWQGVLAALTEQGIDIPEFANSPIEFGINDSVGVKWDEKGVTVSAWMVDLGSLGWLRDTTTEKGETIHAFYAALPSCKMQEPDVITSMILLGYTASMHHNVDYGRGDMLVGGIDNNKRIWVFNKAYNEYSAAQFETAMQDKYLLYELATPIRIDFDEPMHFDLVNAQPDDLITMDDIDGQPMYKVDVENYIKEEDGEAYRKTSVYPSPEWVEAHQQLPVSMIAVLQNIGTSFNSAFLVNLANRELETEGKMAAAERSITNQGNSISRLDGQQTTMQQNMGALDNLNETIKAENLVESLNKVAGYINGDLESVATGIVLEESSNPEWSLLGNVRAIDRVINKYGAIVIDPVNKVYARLSDDDLNTFADGTAWSGEYGEAVRHFAPLHYLMRKDAQGRWTAWGSQEELNGHAFAENFVGCYQGSVGADGALHSRPNVNVTASKTMTAFWDAAQVLGTDWGLMDYRDHQKMMLMHLLKFGTANSDNTMGTGLCNNPSGGTWYNYKTGSCAQMGIHTGAMPHVDNNAFKQCHLFGVEGLAGGSWEFRPGIRFDGQRCIVYEGNIVSNTAEGREFLRDVSLNLSGSYIKQMALGEHFDVIPTVGGGSASTYWCDGAWSASGGQLLLVGGRSDYGSGCGLSAANSYHGFSYSDAAIGARLSFRGDLHELQLVEGARIAALNI